ncbi:MAG TPA: hypothetical protein VFV68_14045 [Agriterribacter sp.]|nr:hypothetical protein [Agriterribacter sp.]
MSLPEALLQTLQQVKGFSKEAFEQVHASGEQVTSVRINPFKWQANLPFATYDLPLSSPVPWCSTGYYLSGRPSFTLDPGFHAGAYYVQEASSMFLEQMIKKACPDHATERYKVLDLCAAPGGKTTHLSALFPQGLIVANEVIKTRTGIVTENVTKWGKENIVVTNNDAEDFKKLAAFFDVIVVDAPCSGSGMFRKDPDAINEWSLQNVDHCSKRQQRIIEDVWPALKENGVLIYSTCSYSAEENEAIAGWMAERYLVETIPLNLDEYPGIVETMSDNRGMYGYRFYPDKIKGEGFFIAGLKKKEAAVENWPRPKKFTKALAQEETAILPFLSVQDRWSFIQANDEVLLLNKADVDDIVVLFSALYIKKMGVKAGKVIRNELVPAHELALSVLISKQVKAVELDKEMALNYLRRNDIEIETNSKGWVLVTYMGLRLGWVKILQNRVNNYYPQQLRILKR